MQVSSSLRIDDDSSIDSYSGLLIQTDDTVSQYMDNGGNCGGRFVTAVEIGEGWSFVARLSWDGAIRIVWQRRHREGQEIVARLDSEGLKWALFDRSKILALFFLNSHPHRLAFFYLFWFLLPVLLVDCS